MTDTPWKKKQKNNSSWFKQVTQFYKGNTSEAHI